MLPQPLFLQGAIEMCRINADGSSWARKQAKPPPASVQRLWGVGGGYNEVANPPQEAGKESSGLRILGSTHSEYLPDTCTTNTDELTG